MDEEGPRRSISSNLCKNATIIRNSCRFGDRSRQNFKMPARFLEFAVCEKYLGNRDLAFGVRNRLDIHFPVLTSNLETYSTRARKRNLDVITETVLQIAFTDAEVVEKIRVILYQGIDVLSESGCIFALHHVVHECPCLCIKDAGFSRFVVVRRC